jgi:hypothetical protein
MRTPIFEEWDRRPVSCRDQGWPEAANDLTNGWAAPLSDEVRTLVYAATNSPGGKAQPGIFLMLPSESMS